MSEEGDETGDEATDSATDGGVGDTGDDGSETCHSFHTGLTRIGEPCARNQDCESLVCDTYEQFVPAGTGTCLEAPEGCRTLFQGTLRDLMSGEVIAGGTIGIIGGAGVPLGFSGASRKLVLVTDDQGRFKGISDEPLDDPFGVLGLVEHEDYVNTALPAGDPDDEGNYEPSIRLKDWRTISETDISTWEAALADDPDVAEFLPLDQNGVSVHVVRSHGHPSTPLAGATAGPIDADSSSLIVRYLDEDGDSFDAAATTSLGIFVLFAAGPGERFDVQLPEWKVESTRGARVAPFSDGIFFTFVNMTPAR